MDLTVKQIEERKEVLKVLHGLGNNFGIKINSEKESDLVLNLLEELFPTLYWASGSKPTEFTPSDNPNILIGFPFVLNVNFKIFNSYGTTVEGKPFITYSDDITFKSLYNPLSYIVDFTYAKS